MRLSHFVGCLGSALLLGACASSQPAGRYHTWAIWRPNRFDRHGRETGRWRTFYDDHNKQPFTTGRYRHGRPVRTFNYYDPTGRLDRTETYGQDGFCTVTHWYAGGQVARKGQAQWVTGQGRTPRFYWYGPWTSYAPDGQVTGIQTYTDGTLTRAETYAQGQLAQVETYEGSKKIRTETYTDGKLSKVETFEKGLRTGTTSTL